MPRTRIVLGLALFAILAARPAPAADNELSPGEKAEGWQLLFNGRDHTGWTCNTGAPIATPIEEGCLVPYKSGGYIIMHEKKFGDFILKCDVNMGDAECNSGIFFRVGAPKNPVFSGLEVQVENTTGTGLHDFGAIYDLVPPKKANHRGVGEWNTVVLTCRGPEIRVAVNGEEITVMNCDDFPKPGLRPDGTRHKFYSAIKNLPRAGYLGFQDHGHPVYYKNVKLLELKSE